MSVSKGSAEFLLVGLIPQKELSEMRAFQEANECLGNTKEMGVADSLKPQQGVHCEREIQGFEHGRKLKAGILVAWAVANSVLHRITSPRTVGAVFGWGTVAVKHNAVGGCRPKEQAIDHRAGASGGSWGEDSNNNGWARQ